jgi:ferredoxin
MRKYAVTNGCTCCGSCIWECPSGAVTIGVKSAVIDPEKCAGCGACAGNCAAEAITEVETESKSEK